MRTIKFRAWLNNEKKYVIPIAIYFAENIETTKIDYIDDGKIKSVIKTQFELEQYTGLTDKNGKEIYEGDIVKQLMYVLKGQDCFTTWVVRWNNGDFCYDLHRVAGASYGDSMLVICKDEDCEVIGNIHKNKEEK